MSAASLIGALPTDAELKPLRLDRVAVVSSIRRLVYSRHYDLDRRARWAGLWFDRLMQLEAAGIAYPFGGLSTEYEPLTSRDYDRIAQLLRDAENKLLEGTRWDLSAGKGRAS